MTFLIDVPILESESPTCRHELDLSQRLQIWQPSDYLLTLIRPI